jgi:hypothetical protein
MARIRSIKPEFWTDVAVVECSPNARLLFIGTWTFADDCGNLDRSAKQLKVQIFPADNIDCEPLINELTRHELLIEYTSAGKAYLHIKNFRRHQRIDRPGPPRFPEFVEYSSKSYPQANQEPLSLQNSEHTENKQFDEQSSNTRRAFAPGGEGSGGESKGKGKGEDLCEHRALPVDNSPARAEKTPEKPNPKPRKPKPLPEEIPKPEPPKTGWWNTDPGILATAKTLNLPAISGETVRALKERCFAEIERMKSANAVPLPTIQPPSCAHCGAPFANGGFTSMSTGNVCNPCYAAYLRSEWQPGQPDQPQAPTA